MINLNATDDLKQGLQLPKFVNMVTKRTNKVKTNLRTTETDSVKCYKFLSGRAIFTTFGR